MTLKDHDRSALDGWLAGNFADADLAGLTDDEAATEGLDAETAEWYRQVVVEGRAALAAASLDWRRIGDLANRSVADEADARRWLAGRLDVLSAALARL